MNTARRVLLLTLVHPDFLPPVYAMAQVLRDEQYVVDIITFDSFVPGSYDPGQGINLVEVGKYHDQPIFKKVSLWKRFYAAAAEKIAAHPALIISFCSFSFLCAEAKKKQVPHAYVALEVNCTPETFMESPITFMHIRQTFRKLSRADLVATPSLERSAWLAGRCGLKKVPYTIQNAAYYKAENLNGRDLPEASLPDHFKGKTSFLYTGRISEKYKVNEIARAFDRLEDTNTALIITGFRENDPYCMMLAATIDGLGRKHDILLFPVIPREQMIALQAYADVGICFLQESDSVLDIQMAAPNKIGEYIAHGLYLLTNYNGYTSQFRGTGIATVIDQPTVSQVCQGMRKAIGRVNEAGTAESISSFYRDEYCMQKQAMPIINFLKERETVIE